MTHDPPFRDLSDLPIGSGTLRVERWGFGAHPIVLLHGFGTSGFLWRAVAPALPLGTVTAWAVDLLGYGGSARPRGGDFGIAAQMEYVERAMTALRLPAATVIGVDLGAVVAHRLAALRPERVRSLVLIGAPRPDATRGADVGALPGAMARSLFEAHSGMTGASLLLGPLLTRAVADPARMPPRLIATYAAAFAGREGIAHLTAVAGAIDDEGLAGLPRVTARTLVLRGALDAWSSVGDATAVAAAVAGATLEVVPDAGRLIPEDRPAWLAERLGGWVADEPPGNTFGGLRVE